MQLLNITHGARCKLYKNTHAGLKISLYFRKVPLSSSVFCHCSGEKKTGDNSLCILSSLFNSFKKLELKVADKNGFKEFLTVASANDQMFSFMLILKRKRHGSHTDVFLFILCTNIGLI